MSQLETNLSILTKGLGTKYGVAQAKVNAGVNVEITLDSKVIGTITPKNGQIEYLPIDDKLFQRVIKEASRQASYVNTRNVVIKTVVVRAWGTL